MLASDAVLERRTIEDAPQLALFLREVLQLLLVAADSAILDPLELRWL